jgi:plastocyanin
MYRRFLKLVPMVFAAVLLAATPSWAANHNVTVGPDTAFHPSTLTINAGDTVTWTNSGGHHNVHADDGSFGNSLSSGAWTFTRTFPSAGTVGYHCQEHGSPSFGMFGTIIVEGDNGGDGFLTTPAFPDFRFRVRIFQGDQSILGRKETACLPETLCVSGAVAGRSEVFLRVVGPRPNGFLWPTIVRFTPSRVVVEIQQISTGSLKNYDLAAVPADSQVLPGLQDRMGFLP